MADTEWICGKCGANLTHSVSILGTDAMKWHHTRHLMDRMEERLETALLLLTDAAGAMLLQNMSPEHHQEYMQTKGEYLLKEIEALRGPGGPKIYE